MYITYIIYNKLVVRFTCVILFKANNIMLGFIYNKEIFLQLLKKPRKILEYRQSFIIASNMTSSGLWENVTITKFNT